MDYGSASPTIYSRRRDATTGSMDHLNRCYRSIYLCFRGFRLWIWDGNGSAVGLDLTRMLLVLAHVGMHPEL